MKSVIVTGASSGIGRAALTLFAERGWKVAATARDPSSLPASGPNVLPIALDVTDGSSMLRGMAMVRETFGRIDVLVNNAGYGVFGPLEGATMDEIERQFRTNVIGVVEMIRHVLPVMRAQQDGTIVNVSSIGGRTAAPFASLYHASKFAIEGLSESLRYECSVHGIRVKLVEPAHFKTDFIRRSLRLVHHEAYEKQLRNYMEWVLEEDRKAPSPEPVARTILKAAEDRSAKLRYPVKAGMILALTRILPDAVWRPLMEGGMTRRPKKRSRRQGIEG